MRGRPEASSVASTEERGASSVAPRRGRGPLRRGHDSRDGEVEPRLAQRPTRLLPQCERGYLRASCKTLRPPSAINENTSHRRIMEPEHARAGSGMYVLPAQTADMSNPVKLVATIED